MTRVALCVRLTASQQAKLRDGLTGVELVTEGLEGCEIAFGNPEPAKLGSAEQLRWLQLESVGFGEYLDLNWRQLGRRLTVTNLAGMFANPAAETGLAGILALFRGIDRLVVEQGRRNWIGDRVRAQMHLLSRKRVVMFGRGAINTRLAALLEPFGCAITYFGSDWASHELDAALGQADIVVSTVPDTPATRGVFDKARFSAFKVGAIFCNLGRGTVVDEHALVAALTTGQVGGSVIDVTVDEPLPREHPLWTAPNTLLTQHSAGGTSDENDLKIDWFLENYRAYRNNAPLRSVVDFSKGY